MGWRPLHHRLGCIWLHGCRVQSPCERAWAAECSQGWTLAHVCDTQLHCRCRYRYMAYGVV